MNKVVTINLGGRAYQLEESGYDALRKYLDEATLRLAKDPGKAEIIADLEQAIGEKCDKTLSPHKTVVTEGEVKKIIDEMGPVEGEGASDGEGGKESAPRSGKVPHRFFLIREGAVFMGVCTGLAAYFDIDVTLVRVLFVLLTVLTGGIWVILYVALGFLVPYANTAEAKAQAYGEPFNAEALVQRAKERWSESYERVTGEKWGDDSDLADAMKAPGDALRSAHAQHLKWRAERRRQRAQWKAQRYARHHPNHFLGFLMGVLGLTWILAEISLISSGAIFGWTIPSGIPVWAAVIILFIAYQAITGPLRGANYAYYGYDGNYYLGYDAWEGFVGVLTALFIVIALVWAYTQIPQVYQFVHHPIVGSHEIGGYLKSLFNR